MVNYEKGSRLINIYQGESLFIYHSFNQLFIEYQSYINETENYYDNRFLQLKKEQDDLIEKEKHKGNSEEYEEYLENVYYNEYMYLELFNIPVSRASILIQLWTFFEFEIVNISKYLRKNQIKEVLAIQLKKIEDKDKINDIEVKEITKQLSSKFSKIDNVDDAKKILSEFKITLGDNSQWKFLQSIRKIRNKLIHNQGRIFKEDSDWETIEKFNKENPNFISIEYVDWLDQEYLIRITSKEFNTKVLNEMKTFFKELMEKLFTPKKINSF